MLKVLRPWFVAIAILATILAASTLLRAGPLSDTEVSLRLHGVPTAMQNIACTSSSATATNALPPSSLVRIAIEGTGGLYYNFVAQAGTVTLANGAYLANGLPPEYVQNAANQYFACIVRSTSVTASIAVMQ